MMKHPRLLSLLIALVLCLFVGAAGAEVTSTTTTYTVDAEALGLPSNDELFAYYVEQKLYGYEWATFNRAVDQLSERQQKLYAHLEAALEKIATGQTASTVVVVDAATLSACGYSATGSISTQEEYNAAAEQFSTEIDADFDVVNAALVIDHPFEMYWYDKQTQLRCSFPLKNGNELDFSATFTFYPVENFQPASGYDEEAPTVDTAKTSAATSATTKAQEIVAKYARVSDYEKIIGYMNEICALTSYNDAAAETVKNGTDYGSNSPWQLLWVFDGYTSTEVVCEGYAKAFQYLCDLTTFDSALVESRIVTGNLSEGIGAGPHMWNVVTMDDGYNYIVDVTNTDGNSVGNQGQFKLGGTSNYQTNYDPTPDTADNWGDTYAFYCNAQQTMYFTYDSDMTSVYAPADLALAPYNYADVAYITAADGTITGYADIEDAVSAWADGATLTLRKNCTVSESIVVASGETKTLNLNGCTLEQTSTADAITNSGTLTITGNGTIKSASIGITTNTELIITGMPTFDCSIPINSNGGTVNLAAMGDAVNNLKVYIKAATTFTLPSGYALCDTDGNVKDTTGTAYVKMPVSTYVAEVDGTKYAEFSTAVANWTSGTTLTLLDDVQITSGIKLDTYYGDKVLDLNGHQLSNNSNGVVLMIYAGNVLTIQDTAGNGKIVGTADGVSPVQNDGKLTITGGTFEAGNAVTIANSSGTLNISGNTVISNTSNTRVAVLYPTSISGNVKINGTVDIGFKKMPDLKTATNCKGWVVKNYGDAPAMLYADVWLPDGYALKIGTKIDYELDPDATGTIVAHSTCTENDWGNDDESHWKKCDCGRTLIYGLHTMELVDNGDGTHSLICTDDCGYPEPVDREKLPHSYTYTFDGATHTAACACGATVTEPHTLGYTSAGNGTHDVTCTKSCGYSATAVTCTNVTCTPVSPTTTIFNHNVVCNDCKNEYTEGCNVGTCPKCGAHGVIVDKKRLTTANAGDVLGDHTVSYDAATRTLSLNEANTTYVYSNHKLTVAYSGENTLSQHIGAPKLVLNAASGAKLNAASIGGSLSVEVEINGGTVNLSGEDNPIEAGNLTINNAIVVANNPSYTAPTINLAGKLTLDGNSHLTSTRGTNGYAVASDGIEGNGYYRTAANGAFTRFEEITGNVYIENYYEYVGAEHLGKFVDDKNGATHSATCACGTTVTEPHTFNADNVCTGCGVSNTVTVTLYANGAKIVKINGEDKTILNGETFTVPRGQDLKVKFANTVSQKETGVNCDGYVYIDQNLIMCNYNEATNTLTIPGSKVTGNIVIDVDAYVLVQFNLHGGALTDTWKKNLEEFFECTWVADTSTLKATYGLGTGNFLSEYFQLDGHTFVGAMVDGSDKVVQSLSIFSDMTVDILWNCTDTTTTLTPVPAKAATCKEAGNIAHYVCTCDKLYAEDKSTVLTAEDVKTDIDPDNHNFDPDTGMCVCGAVKTYTIALNAGGVKIVEINGEAVEIFHGETFTVPRGQELTVKFANTLSTQEKGVYFNGYVIIDENPVRCAYDEDTNTLTIPGSIVTSDIVIGANAYLHVQFNLHGGTLTEDGEWAFNYYGSTWDAETATLKVYYGRLIGLEPYYFQLAGHTFASAQVEGSDEVETVAMSFTSEKPVDILWECDGSTLTHVPAKDATCTEAGNIAHYICTCDKLYAEDKSTVLTADEVKTDIDSSNHIGMDPATGKCACGKMLAVAKVEWGGNTTYHATLKDLEDGCYGTLTLLADCSYDGLAIQFWAEENVINLNGHTLESERSLAGVQGTLTITGPGTVKGAGITGGVDFEKLIIGANVNLEGKDDYELIFQCGKFDLTQATIPENGWRIRALNSGDGYGAYPTTFGFDNDCNVKLRDGYAAFDTEGNVVAEAAYDTIVTIKAHPEHDYVDGVCGCGVICDHDKIDPTTGKCPVCELQHVASVTIGSEVTYYKTLQEAMAAADGHTATVKLLTDCSFDTVIALYDGSNVTLNLNGKTVNASRMLSVHGGATLTIEGEGNYIYDGNNAVDVISIEGTLNISGGTFSAAGDFAVLLQAWGQVNISGGSFTAEGNQSIPVSISGNVTVSGAAAFFGSTECGDFAITSSGTLDLSGVTGSMDGWCVWNNYAIDGVVIGQTLKLPDDYKLKLGEEFVTSLADDQIGTIVAHTHDYATPQNDDHHHWEECACGATTEKVEHTFTYTPVEGQEVHIVGCSGCTYTAPETPAHAFTNGVCVCTAKAVADVAGTQYAYFANAVAAWTDGTTLTLLADVTYDNSIAFNGGSYTFVGGNYTLDLGDDAISIYSGTLNKGALTIESGTIKTTEGAPLYVHPEASATINSDNTTLIGSDWHIAVEGSERLTINGTGCDGWEIFTNPFNDNVPITIPEGFHLEDTDGNQLAVNDTLPRGKTTVIKADHNHNWSYQADGATITATCSADGCRTSSVVVSLPDREFKYDRGNQHTVTPVYSVDNSGLVAEVTYTGDQGNVTKEGFTATMKLGEVEVSKTYFIMPFSISKAKIDPIPDQTYTGEAIEPTVTPSMGDWTLQDGEFTVGYENNVNVGTATVTVTGKGNYTDTVSKTFEIVPASIADAVITDIADQVYTGEEIKPEVTVTMGNKTLVEGTDYDVTYSNNVNVGEATVTVTGKGNYTRTASTTFQIIQSASTVTAKSYLGDAEQDTFTYGQAITVKGQAAIDAAAQTFALRATPVNTAELYYGETKLAEATVAADNTFTLTYDTTEKKLPVGSHTLTVEFGGTGNLAGESTTVAITLNAKSLTVTGATATSRTYDGTDKVAIADVALEGIIEGDTVSVDTTELMGTISSADAGEYTTVTLPAALTLIGDHAAFYTAAGTEVDSTVTISAKVVTVTDLTIELEPATFVYDGTAKEPAVTVKDVETVIPSTEYTVSYQNNTEVGDATVNIADAEGGNYTVSGSATFEITKGNSDLTAATYLNDVATTDFTYGDVITVKGQATLQQTFALRQVEINKAALFCGDVQLGEPVAVGADGTYTLTYDTTGKGLAIGENTLTVVYGGSGNLAGQTATVKVTLNKADPEVNIPADLTATYGDLLADVTLTSEPDNTAGTWAWNDPTAPVGDAGTQTHKATFTPSDTDYFNTAEVDVSITVGKLALTGVTLPENMTLPTYCATADEAKAKLPETVAYTGEDGKTYTLPATWSCTDYNAAPDATSTFTWTVETPQTNFEFAEGVATTGTITVKNGTAVAVTITGTDAAITYDGNPYDVSAMFTIDQNAGAATYSIVANGTDTGAGTLEGSVLTITKAGTITIQVNTAANTVEGMPYAPGEATAVLTVSKGTMNVTAPTGLTASYGDTLASVTLPADENGTWAWKDTSTETKVGDAGERTHKAIFTPTNTNLWDAVEVDVTITVTKAAIILDGVAATYLDNEAKTEFVYGQTITVRATPVMPAVLNARMIVTPEPNQMALFLDNEQISAPADADANGVYTMTYQTTDKALTIGTSDILVKYIGTDNHESGILPLKVTLLPAELKVSSVTLKDRTYEPGNTQVEVTAATLSGILDDDEVLADTAKMLCILKADGAMSDKAGSYTEVILPETIPLTGAHASFYTAKGGTAINATVTITKATPEATGTPDMGDVTPGTQLKDVPTDAIEELYKPVEGTVTWDDPDATVEPGKEYDYTFTPDDTENYEPVEGSTVIIPLAPPQPEVPPVVLPTVIVPAEDQLVTVYEGETADMSVTAINADAYQWYINRNDGMGWRPIIGANTPAYTTSVTTLNDDGCLYLCRVSNADGAVNSPVFTLDVLPALDVPPTGDNAPVMLWASLLLMSAALMIMAGKKRRFN
ncbi:MAG: hypothetical protein IJA83_04460 [Clostridia bacterium]|nr:hypothetical protein [Clostridia bacterium]